MSYALLGLEDVVQIKKDIWEGNTLERVANMHNISIGYAGNISSGRAYDYIPWPDSSRGPLPMYRKHEINTLRRQLGKNSVLTAAGAAKDAVDIRDTNRLKVAESVAAAMEDISTRSQPAVKHTDTSIPDVRTINVVMDGRDIEYVPQTEMPKLPDDLQELYDAVKEDGFIAEVAFGAVVARLPVATWTKERIDPLYQKMRPFIQQLARADRETFKPTQKSN